MAERTRVPRRRTSGARAARPVEAAPRRAPRLFLAAICCAVAAALYWGTLGHPLVFDDRGITAGMLQAHDEARFGLRWLSQSTFIWIHALSDGDWRWQRAVNALLHAGTGVVLFLFLDRLLEAVIPRGRAPAAALDTRWIALLGALLFVVHPVAVYGPAYLVQRSIVLATFFSVASLRLFLEGLLRPSRRWHVAAAAAYLLAVCSKEHSVALPAVAAALAVLVRGWPARGLWRELALPFSLFAAIALVVIVLARDVLGAQYEPAARALIASAGDAGAGSSGVALYPLSVVNQAALFFRYLATWMLPYPGWMSVDLRVPFPGGLWPWSAAFIAWLALPLAALALLARGGLRGLAGLGLLWPWLLALTEIATVRVQEPFALYRSYLWMSGLPVLLAPALARLPARWSAGAVIAACVALVPVTLGRLDTFSSQVKLWDDVVRKNDGGRAALVERGYHNRGLAHLQAGRYAEALADFDRALALNPRDVNAWVGRGTLFARTGRPERALDDLGRAIEIDPGYAEAWGKRCFAKMLLERPHDALSDCEKAVTINPRYRDGHTNLGVVYAALRRSGDAEASYRRALALDPRNADAHYNYAVLLLVTRRREAARDALRRACNAGAADACGLLEASFGAPR